LFLVLEAVTVGSADIRSLDVDTESAAPRLLRTATVKETTGTK